MHTSPVPSLGLDHIWLWSQWAQHRLLAQLTNIQKALKITVRPRKFPQRWSQTLSPKPVVSPSLVPCNEVTFQHNGLWGTSAQCRAKEELFSNPLQSCSHSRILKTELRNRDETWKKYETQGAPDRKGPCRVAAARAGCLRAVPRRGWCGLHTGVGHLAFSCTRCALTDTPLLSSCFHYQWGKCNWEKDKMTQGSHGQMLHVPKSWKQLQYAGRE